MDVVTSLDDLTPDELRRIRNTLLRRFQDHQESTVVEIGFGRAERKGRNDPRRPHAACFYVTRKYTSATSPTSIPTRVRVRVKRDARFIEVRLPTDVIVLSRRPITATGTTLRHQLKLHETASSNCIVAWRYRASGALQWGMLTSGHLFHERHVVPEPLPRVRILARAKRYVWGTLMARSRPRDGSQVDAALIGVSRESLVEGGLLPDEESTVGKVVRSVASLTQDPGAEGISLPTRAQIPFTVDRYLPICSLVPELGNLEHVLDVGSRHTGAFGKGRSGTLWVIDRQAACLQFAGLPTRFRRGWGQSLKSVLAWTEDQLSRRHRIPASQIDLRIVHVV